MKWYAISHFQSIDFHEGGRKHQFNVQNRLTSIRSRAAIKDKREAKEEQWLAQMEKVYTPCTPD